uniref:Uncharacterized protein n=1 Tax=Oryza glumipatula TaxID=40148 RepID=A0A0E0BDS8_9ORYZ
MAGTPGRRPPAAGSAPQRNPTGGRVMDASSGISDLGLWKMDLSDDVYQLLSEVKHMNLMMETVATAHSEYANMEWLPLPAGTRTVGHTLSCTNVIRVG